MFDLITGERAHAPSPRAMPMVVSSALHVVAIILLAIPFLFITERLPEVPTMMAFVAPTPAPPPPPPPPPPPSVAKAAKPVEEVARRTGDFVAPTEAPAEIRPETGLDEGPTLAEGVEGGVVGGIAGGVVGGIVGGLPPEPIAPPPPPVVAKADKPVRIGGDIRAPALVKRVEPTYPAMAAAAQLEGLAILEAIVDEEGRVVNVTVLRSAHPLLDREAIAAVKQWRYSPLTLNGKHQPFILTVTLSFSLTRQRPAPTQ